MKDRLLKIIKQYNLTSTRFADVLGVQRSGISHILSGRNQPSYDFIVKLMKQYPEINPDWLIMGNGTIFRTAVKFSEQL
jgi:plasmid maintenance system antidote protein VapI